MRHPLTRAWWTWPRALLLAVFLALGVPSLRADPALFGLYAVSAVVYVWFLTWWLRVLYGVAYKLAWPLRRAWPG